MKETRFSLNISPEKYLQFYQGQVQQIVVTSNYGKKIQFPAKELRQFVTHTGIHGNFRILYSEQNKLVRIERV